MSTHASWHDAVEATAKALSTRWLPTKSDELTFEFTYVVACGIPLAGIAWIHPEASGLHLRLIFGVVPTKARDEIIKYITRANYDLVHGCFALHPDTGDLRFKASLFFHSAELSPAWVSNLIEISLEVVDLHAEALIHVIGGASASTARAHVAEENAQARRQARPPLEQFVKNYLRSILRGEGVTVSDDETAERFWSYVSHETGSRYPIEIFEGLRSDMRNHAAVERLYNDGELRFRVSARGRQFARAFLAEDRVSP